MQIKDARRGTRRHAAGDPQPPHLGSRARVRAPEIVVSTSGPMHAPVGVGRALEAIDYGDVRSLALGECVPQRLRMRIAALRIVAKDTQAT
jgi:hypothetical protein